MIIAPPNHNAKPWVIEQVTLGKQAILDAGFRISRWQCTEEGVWRGNIWTSGKIDKWEPRMWLVPHVKGISHIFVGYDYIKVPVWAGDGVKLRHGQAENLRSSLIRLQGDSRRHLWCWQRMQFPAGAGVQLGAASERLFSPWLSKDTKRHGGEWMAREPIEHRGLTLLEGLEEVLTEEWDRRLRHNWHSGEAARAIAKMFRWWKEAWPIPRILWSEALSETKKGLSSKRKSKSTLKAKPLVNKRRSLISDETRLRLKQEPRPLWGNPGCQE
jgi:hypothetical protein